MTNNNYFKKLLFRCWELLTKWMYQLGAGKPWMKNYIDNLPNHYD